MVVWNSHVRLSLSLVNTRVHARFILDNASVFQHNDAVCLVHHALVVGGKKERDVLFPVQLLHHVQQPGRGF